LGDMQRENRVAEKTRSKHRMDRVTAKGSIASKGANGNKRGLATPERGEPAMGLSGGGGKRGERRLERAKNRESFYKGPGIPKVKQQKVIETCRKRGGEETQ